MPLVVSPSTEGLLDSRGGRDKKSSGEEIGGCINKKRARNHRARLENQI